MILKSKQMSRSSTKSAICTHRSIIWRTSFMIKRGHQKPQRPHSARSAATARPLSKSSRTPKEATQHCHQPHWWQKSHPHHLQRLQSQCSPHLNLKQGPQGCHHLNLRQDHPHSLQQAISQTILIWRWMMKHLTGSQKSRGIDCPLVQLPFQKDGSAEDWDPQSQSGPSITSKVLKRITWHMHQVMHSQTPPSFKRGRGWWTELWPNGLWSKTDSQGLSQASCCLHSEAAIPFSWRPVPEHLANLLGIGEPLPAGDPPWIHTQKGESPQIAYHWLSYELLNHFQGWFIQKFWWFTLCSWLLNCWYESLNWNNWMLLF